MNITDVKTHTERAKPCSFRDVAEPVSFALTARLEITMSRFSDVEPVTAERLKEIVRKCLEMEGITVLP
jgi:hypothetical protein